MRVIRSKMLESTLCFNLGSLMSFAYSHVLTAKKVGQQISFSAVEDLPIKNNRGNEW